MKLSSLLVCAATSLSLVACGHVDDSDATLSVVDAIEQYLNDSMDETRDCKYGGIVRIVASVIKEDSPGNLDLDATWTYTDCVSKKLGTVNGSVVYSKLVTETVTDTYRTELSYTGNVTYSADAVGNCNANVTADNTSDNPNYPVYVATVCAHPEMKKFEKLEKKCKLKKKKKKPGKKDKCELKL